MSADVGAEAVTNAVRVADCVSEGAKEVVHLADVRAGWLGVGLGDVVQRALCRAGPIHDYHVAGFVVQESLKNIFFTAGTSILIRNKRSKIFQK